MKKSIHSCFFVAGIANWSFRKQEQKLTNSTNQTKIELLGSSVHLQKPLRGTVNCKNFWFSRIDWSCEIEFNQEVAFARSMTWKELPRELTQLSIRINQVYFFCSVEKLYRSKSEVILQSIHPWTTILISLLVRAVWSSSGRSSDRRMETKWSIPKNDWQSSGTT